MRPEISSLEDFDELVVSWLSGNGQGLAKLVAPRVPASEHSAIDRLFDE
jgi:hypothetical protein